MKNLTLVIFEFCYFTLISSLSWFISYLGLSKSILDHKKVHLKIKLRSTKVQINFLKDKIKVHLNSNWRLHKVKLRSIYEILNILSDLKRSKKTQKDLKWRKASSSKRGQKTIRKVRRLDSKTFAFTTLFARKLLYGCWFCFGGMDKRGDSLLTVYGEPILSRGWNQLGGQNRKSIHMMTQFYQFNLISQCCSVKEK